MKKNGLFSLLSRNTIRILKNSKILIFQLGMILLIGLTIITTIFMSTFLLSKSKNTVLKNSDIADLTVTIPQSYIKESLSNDHNSKFINEYSGQTPADLELQEYLTTLNLDYVFSKNLSVSDNNTSNSFVLSNINSQTSINTSTVNSLVLEEGQNLPISSFKYNDPYIYESFEFFYTVRSFFVGGLKPEDFVKFTKLWTYNNYLKSQPWKLANILINSTWSISDSVKDSIINNIIPLLQIPKNEQDFINNYYPFVGTIAPGNWKINPNSYFYKLSQYFSLTKIESSEYSFSFLGSQVIPVIGIGADIPFEINYIDKASFFTILSSNFLSNNPNKKILDPRTISGAMQLPYKSNVKDNNSLNPSLSYKVYNQDTDTYEIQKDFLSWFNNLNDKYKISINSLNYIITGSGNQSNLLYPIQNSSQLLVNSKNNGVAYINNSGFARITNTTSYQPLIYYSIRFPTEVRNNLIVKNKIFNDLKNWTESKYGHNSAYYLSDSNQSNKLFYLWSNSLNNFQYIITTLGIIIGSIIVLLSLIFISLLIRSIIKINKITFGVCLSNGVSKIKLALSFFPFALFPSFIFGTLSFFLSYLLVNPIIGTIRSYWTLNIDNSFLYWWIWLIIVLSSFLLLYSLIIIIIFITLRNNTQNILNDSDALKVNPLIIGTKNLTRKMSPLWSFRTTFMMSNVSRFLILMFSIISLVTISTIIVGSQNLFQTSLDSNSRNKNYLVAYDLYSPTINGGYYSDINYNMLGTSQKGSFNAYDTTTNNYSSPSNAKGEFYNGQIFNNTLSYPYSKDLWFTSLFMVNSNIANEVNWNFHFLNNRLFSKNVIDSEINVLGAIINPWNFAEQVLPESIRYMAESNEELLIQTNYDFYYWLQQQNKIALNNETDKFINMPELIGTEFEIFNQKPITYKDYLPNVNGQPFTLDNSDLTEDYNTAPNKNQWIYIKSYDSNVDKYKWIFNKDFAINAAPSFAMKPQTTQLFVQLLTNNENPLYKFWYSYIYNKNPNKGIANQTIPNYNYKMGSSMVPIDQTEETYTYLTSNIYTGSNYKYQNVTNARVIGIKENSNSVYLYDENNKDLKPYLQSYVVEEAKLPNGDIVVPIYPLIINNVVQTKYEIELGDTVLLETTNTFDRFNRINVNENPNQYSLFKVIGITPSNYEEQYYTLQKYANKILGFKDFSNVINNVWESNIAPSKGYIPFNGVFSNDKTFKMINNFGGFYSPSGLSTIVGNIGGFEFEESMGTVFQVFKNNSKDMNKLMNAELFVDRNNNNEISVKTLNDKQTFSEIPNQVYDVFTISNRIAQLFNNISPIVTQIQNFDSFIVSATLGNTLDTLLTQMEIIILVSLVPTIIFIITLLATIIIFEAKRLISLLKLLGYGDWRNIFSFLFVYIVVLVLGTIVSIPVIISINQIIKYVAFTTFGVITMPLMPAWILAASFGAIALIFALLFVYIYYKMKKINLSQEISVR